MRLGAHEFLVSADALSVDAMSTGGDSDFSHSCMRSAAVRLMLPGVKRFSAAGHVMSLALLPEGDDGENEERVELRFLSPPIVSLL